MFTRKPTPTLGKALRTAVLRAVATTVMLAAGFVGMQSYMADAPIPTSPEQGDVMQGRTPAEGAPTTVLARMGDKCWTGEAPADMAGIVPGHVVYSDGSDGAKVGGSRMVGIALDSIFEKPVKGLTVYAFCR